MYKHILLPTDGSSASELAVAACMQFARETGAHVTAVHVAPRFHVFTYRPEMLEDTRDTYLRDSEAAAARLLEGVEQAALEHGVACDTVIERDDHPYEAIIRQARDRGCDLIMMASHGLHGVKAMLLGSETHKVLVHSAIPVLVVRGA